jgi:hypothetical protein
VLSPLRGAIPRAGPVAPVCHTAGPREPAAADDGVAATARAAGANAAPWPQVDPPKRSAAAPDTVTGVTATTSKEG